MLTNPSIDFIKEKLLGLDSLAEEISFSNGKHEEIFFNLKNNFPKPYSDCFNALIAEYFADIPKSKIEAISFQAADGAVYGEDKIMLLLNGARRDCFLYPEIGCFNPWIDYCLSTTVCTRNRIAKFYDMDRKSYESIPIPKGAIVGKKYGVGVGVKSDVVGIYLLSTDYDLVVEFYGKPDPLPLSIKQQVLARAPIHPFGIVFNETAKEILKLNYYVYHDYERDGASKYLREIKDAAQQR